MRKDLSLIVLLLLGDGLLAQNPRFTFRLDGPCGETIVGPAGSTYDNGTGGKDFFFDPGPYYADTNRNGDYDLVEVPRNRPGHTWDVVLNTSDNPVGPGACGWSFGVGVEGPLTITDVTTLGTAGCSWFLGPPCLERGGYSLTELTGPPYGVGPETDAGARCQVTLHLRCYYAVPAEGDAAVAKIRVSAKFPDTEGEVVRGRVLFAERTGSDNSPQPILVFHRREIRGVALEPCEFQLRAASPIAPFVRCDPNDDGGRDISNAVWIFKELFRGGPVTACPAAADCDGDGTRNITDGIYALLHLFTGGPPPPAPYPECGSAPGMVPEDCPFGSTRCPP